MVKLIFMIPIRPEKVYRKMIMKTINNLKMMLLMISSIQNLMPNKMSNIIDQKKMIKSIYLMYQTTIKQDHQTMLMP